MPGLCSQVTFFFNEWSYIYTVYRSEVTEMKVRVDGGRTRRRTLIPESEVHILNPVCSGNKSTLTSSYVQYQHSFHYISSKTYLLLQFSTTKFLEDSTASSFCDVLWFASFWTFGGQLLVEHGVWEEGNNSKLVQLKY